MKFETKFESLIFFTVTYKNLAKQIFSSELEYRYKKLEKIISNETRSNKHFFIILRLINAIATHRNEAL